MIASSLAADLGRAACRYNRHWPSLRVLNPLRMVTPSRTAPRWLRPRTSSRPQGRTSLLLLRLSINIKIPLLQPSVQPRLVSLAIYFHVDVYARKVSHDFILRPRRRHVQLIRYDSFQARDQSERCPTTSADLTIPTAQKKCPARARISSK